LALKLLLGGELGNLLMTITEATSLVRTCADQMNVRYQNVVFDEWAIVSLARGKQTVLAYSGPRKESFEKQFFADAGTLRTGLFYQNLYPGDFEFAHDGVGTGFESFTVLGPNLYLIWNNTGNSMDGIAKDPRWLGAQVPFANLSDRFRSDPVLHTRC
jgi:hypothetical protein